MTDKKESCKSIVFSLSFIFLNIFVTANEISEKSMQMKEKLIYPLRNYSSDITLEKDFKSPVIISPEIFIKKAKVLEDVLKKKGILDIETINDKDVVKGRCMGLKENFSKRPLIILGNLQQNEAIFPLYAGFYTNADAFTPGKDGVLIQFIPNWNCPENHVLIAAGSDNDGTEKAIDVLIDKLTSIEKNTALSSLQLFDYKNEALRERTKKSSVFSKSKEDKFTWEKFYTLSELYLENGDKKFLDLITKIAERMPSNTWNDGIHDNHYGMELPVRGWDTFARSGQLSPKLVQKIDQIFLNYLINWENAWWRRKENTPVFYDNRHHVYGTWGYWHVAKMLLNGLTEEQRKSEVGRFLEEKCRECEVWFSSCCRNYEQSILSTGVFINYTIFMLYAFQSGDLEIFRNGGAQKIASLAVSAVDNTGGRVGIAGYEDVYPGTLFSSYPVGPVICLAAFYYKDWELAWLRKHLPGFSTQTWWNLCMDNHSYSFIPDKISFATSYLGFNPIFGTPETPLFLSFRKNYGLEYLYLFITGSGTRNINKGDSGKERQVFPNMIARLSWLGVPWLIQNTNRETVFNRNAMLIDTNNAMTGVANDMELIYNGKINDTFFCSTLAKKYMGSDWKRSYIIVDNSILLIEDDIKALKDADYRAIATWRTPFYVTRKSATVAEIRCNDKYLFISSPENYPHNFDMKTGRALEREGAVKPGFIRQYIRDNLKNNASMILHNLIYPSSKATPSDFSIRSWKPHISLIKNNKTGEIIIAGFSCLDEKKLSISADAFLLDMSSFRGIGKNVSLNIEGNKITNQQIPINLKRILNEIWNSISAENKIAPSSQNFKKEIIWSYDSFTMLPRKLNNFIYNSPNTNNLDWAVDGELKRGECAKAKNANPIEISVDFDKEENLREITLLYSHDSGKGNVSRIVPRKSLPVKLSNEDGNIPHEINFHSEFFYELDEAYKGAPYIYNGSKILLDVTGKKFRIKIPASALYQISFYGKEEKTRVKDIKLLGSNKKSKSILILTDTNEIVCLSADTGKCRWKTLIPSDILDWTVGTIDNNEMEEIGLACMDMSVKKLNPENGEIIFSCPTSPIALGLPYSVATFKGGKDVPPGFIFSSYYHMNVIDNNGKLLASEQKILPGMWIYDIMGGSIDLNNDGVSDAIGRALWGHVNLYDGKTGKVDYFANLRGHLVDWKLIKDEKTDKPLLIVATLNGLGMYDAYIRNELLHEGFKAAPDEDALLLEKRSDRKIWEHKFEATATNLNIWQNEIIISHATGMISRFSLAGEFLGKFSVWPAVINMDTALIGNKECLLVNTGRAIIVFNQDFKRIKEIPLENYKMKILDNGKIILVCTLENGVSELKIK